MMAGLGSFYAWSVFRRPLSELYGESLEAGAQPMAR